MPHVHETGTAWDRNTEDYAYTRDLDKPGWAWEFLRRNTGVQRDFEKTKMITASSPTNVNGVQCHNTNPSEHAAGLWGLCVIPDTKQSALEVDVFWHPDAISSRLHLRLSPFSGQTKDAFALEDFKCCRAILLQHGLEHLVLRNGMDSVRLTASGHSLLELRSCVTFEVDGFCKVNASISALQTLSRLRQIPKDKPPFFETTSPKWLDYLIALDGHLAGRSYRDIAEVLHGAERVKSVWTDASRHLKDRTRRAVERGVVLMNGGYRDLL